MVGGSDRGWNEIGEGVEGNRRKGGMRQGKGMKGNRGGGRRRVYELSLHNLNPVCSGLGGLWLFFGFVTIGLSRGLRMGL